MAAPQQPNLLILMADQQSPHVLGHAGDSIVRTPHLNRLAAQGTRCPAAYTGSPLCVPARMTFMTSRPCSDIGVWSNQGVLDSTIRTFASALAAAGYETLLCGRMHFVGPDQRHGFTRRLIGDVTQPRYAAGEAKSLLGDLPPGITGQTAAAVRTAGPGSTSYMAYDDAVTAVAADFLRGEAARREQPWALLVGYVLPHCPFICSGELFDYYHPRVRLPKLPADYPAGLHPVVQAAWERREFGSLTDEQRRVALAAYYGLVEYHDACCGRVLAALEDAGLAEEAVTLYLSDHGEMAGEHGMWTKSIFYEASVGVPLIWRWPGRLPAGAAVKPPVSLLDVGPTLLGLAGAAPLEGVAGESLAPLLRGEESAGPAAVFSEYCGLLGDPPARMIRRGPWKLIHHHGFEQPQLFNLEEDPGEERDLGAEADSAAIREPLHEEVRRDWDGERIAAAMARAEERREAAAARARVTAEADSWPLPPGVNYLLG